jgi:putative ABC transport system permease protein
MIPEFPLHYTFIEQDYENLFRSEMRLIALLKYFTVLALIIASLGLYGLSAYSTERRSNEIGIRKVMGADSSSVIITMAREFMVLVLISIFIALPLGWLVVENLLKQFAYRIEPGIIVFAIIGAGALIIALLTVSFQAFKAARINPVNALKAE